MHPFLSLRKQLKSKSNPRKAKLLQGFFKTGKGEYGEGDVFMGIMVPETRKIANQYKHLKINEIQQLLKSKYHEERLAALLILVSQFQDAIEKNDALRPQSIKNSGNNKSKNNKNKISDDQFALLWQSKNNSNKIAMIGWRRANEIFNFYLKNAKYVNNWDLVDLSAPRIVGQYLLQCPQFALLPQSKNNNSNNKNNYKNNSNVLYKLARSKNLWERRIAIISTLAFIKKDKFEDALKISKMLLSDKHDLIHKSVGWMLREVGKRSQITLEKFLKTNCKNIPRTTLRYAIERFSEKKRKAFLLKTCL